MQKKDYLSDRLKIQITFKKESDDKIFQLLSKIISPDRRSQSLLTLAKFGLVYLLENPSLLQGFFNPEEIEHLKKDILNYTKKPKKTSNKSCVKEENNNDNSEEKLCKNSEQEIKNNSEDIIENSEEISEEFIETSSEKPSNNNSENKNTIKISDLGFENLTI